MNRQLNIWKRFFLIFGSGALLLLSGCEKHPEGEEIIPPTGKTIEFFASSSDVKSRAASGHPILGTEFPANQSFGVYAYQTGFSGTGSVELFRNPENTSSVAFNNTQVTKGSDNSVGYSPKVRWPDIGSGKALRFFAYYPYNHSALTVDQDPNAEQVDLTYTLSGDPSQHVDLMYWMSPQVGSIANPVSVEFGHALTRLRFQARLVPPPAGFPTGTSVQVTRIEIKNAVTEGTMRVTPAGNTIHSAWSLNNAVKTPLVMTTSNGLRDDGYPIPSSADEFTDLLRAGGDMLVIPQDVTGLTMEVTAVINGISRIYTYDLGQTVSKAKWEMNKSVTYQLAFGWNGVSVSAAVSNWADIGYNVIFDGQYYLKTTQKTVTVGSGGGSVPVIFETNYDGLTGYPTGLLLDPGQTTADTWCSVSMGANTGPPGTEQRQVTVSALADESLTAPRTTSFIVKAGNLYYQVTVKQMETQWLTITPSSTGGFALNGNMHSFRLTSNAENTWWKINSVDDPDGILLPVLEWVGRVGDDETLYFFLKGNAIPGQTARITVGGGTTEVVFAITAVTP